MNLERRFAELAAASAFEALDETGERKLAILRKLNRYRPTRQEIREESQIDHNHRQAMKRLGALIHKTP